MSRSDAGLRVAPDTSEGGRPSAGARLSYWLLSGVVLLFVCGQAWNQRWQHDFWQHSACVHELAMKPWSPGNPYLPMAAPHEFYNPYFLMLGLLSRASGGSSIGVLSIMGIANCILFAWGLQRLCRRLCTNPLSAFFTLLFTLVLWGYHPWMFGGFFHLAMLGETAPYPSFFCAALTFLAWSIYVDFAGGRASLAAPLLLSLIIFVVSLSHPHTAVTLMIGLFALWCGVRHENRTEKTFLLAIAALMAVAGALAWPYYSFYDLMAGAGADHHAGNRWMYVGTVRSTFAGLLFIPCLIGRFRRNRRDPIAVMFVMLVCVYALGYVSGRYAFGRNIVYIMFCLHISAADWLARAIMQTGPDLAHRLWRRPWVAPAAAVVLVFAMGFFAVGVYRYRPGRECTYSAYEFLPDQIDQDSVVLTDLATSAFVPSFGGKVVGSRYPCAFVPDHAERRNAVNRFFGGHATHEERLAILRDYKVQFILLDSDRVRSPYVREDICRFGRVVRCQGPLRLIDVQSAHVPADEAPSCAGNCCTKTTLNP